jgi:hypothetical protein
MNYKKFLNAASKINDNKKPVIGINTDISKKYNQYIILQNSK